MSSTRIDRNDLVFDERTYIPNPVFSPIQVLIKLLRIVSPMTTANGWPCKFRSRGNMGSSMLSHDFGLLCRGRRIQTCGHSFFGNFLSNLRASSNCTWEKSDIASALCPSQPGNLAENVHHFCSSRLGRRWALFSEHCIGSRVVFSFCLFVLPEFFFALDFTQIPCWTFLELVPFFIHCGLCVRYFQCLWHTKLF